MQLSEIIEELDSLKISHYEGCEQYFIQHKEDCSCGADEHNAKIDKLIPIIQKLIDYRDAMAAALPCDGWDGIDDE